MYVTAGWTATGIWPQDRNKVLESHWVTGEPRTPVKKQAQPIIPIQPPPEFDEISSPITITTPTPVPVAEEVEDGSDASSIIGEEIVVGELFSDSESRSNYSTEC
jgi:hypothetical protein